MGRLSLGTTKPPSFLSKRSSKASTMIVGVLREDSDLRGSPYILNMGRRGSNYLIANGVEILERCNLRGFVIVSSDKDYLPVMRIATFKKVRKYIYGLNTADIYQRYGIEDIQLIAQFKEPKHL